MATMGRRLLPALCRGGRVATRVRRKRRRASPSSHPSASTDEQLPVDAATDGSKAVVNNDKSAAAAVNNDKSAAAAGGGCYVDGNGALMVGVAGGARRVMVVADGSREAADALQWALAQTVRSGDTVVLLSVVKPVAQEAISDSCVKILEPKCSKHIEAMKSICESRPEVKVETCVVEAVERAPAAVEAARQHGASLLVLAQRRRYRVTRWLRALWRRRRQRRRAGMVEYCIEHAPCVALGVRRRRCGGYLVSSKRHKNFWLLA